MLRFIGYQEFDLLSSLSLLGLNGACAYSLPFEELGSLEILLLTAVLLRPIQFCSS